MSETGASTPSPAHDGAAAEGQRDRLAELDSRVARVEAAVEAVAKQVSFLPPQLRQLGGKVEGLAASLSEPRYRAVLLGLLGVYDLVEQVLRTLPDTADAEGHRRNYEVLRDQLRQLLGLNGLMEIAATGAFDPSLHRAVQRVPCADPSGANQVLEVVRPGFRTEQAVLRYAEVVVGQYADPTSGGAEVKREGDEATADSTREATP